MSEAYNAKYWESQDRIPTIKTRSPKNPNTWRITDNNYGDDTWYTIQFPEEVNEDYVASYLYSYITTSF